VLFAADADRGPHPVPRAVAAGDRRRPEGYWNSGAVNTGFGATGNSGASHSGFGNTGSSTSGFGNNGSDTSGFLNTVIPGVVGGGNVSGFFNLGTPDSGGLFGGTV